MSREEAAPLRDLHEAALDLDAGRLPSEHLAATYPELAVAVRTRFTSPQATLRELFARMVFNVCIGSTDDHARSHAAFWDGRHLTLTPAYDLRPQPRSGGETVRAMAMGSGDDVLASRLQVCLRAATHYHLDDRAAVEIIEHQVEVIRGQWLQAAEAAQLTEAERTCLWGRQIHNPSIFYR